MAEETIGSLMDRAAEGEAEALLELGLAYSGGRMVERDLGRAVEYFRLAFERGLEEPIYLLAAAYEEGGDGLRPDLAESFYWWMQAARYGRLDLAVQACCRVGRAYAEGEVVNKDLVQAVFWLEKAARKGLTEARALLDELKSAGAGS
jgi:TPR repeat protein